MEKDNLRNKLNNDFVFSIVLNGFVLLASLLLFVPHFEENDDAFLAMISEGVYGTRDYHLIYANVILGKLYVFLSGICDCVRWHSVLQYAFLFVAFCLLTYILCKRYKGRLIAVFFVLASFYELYVSLQYSKTAAFVSMVGFLSVFYGSDWLKCTYKDEQSFVPQGRGQALTIIIIGTICCLYGMLLRSSGFYLAGLFAAVTLGFRIVFRLIPVCANKADSIVRAVFVDEVKKIMLFIPVLALLVMTSVVNEKMYSEKAWDSFMTYNDARMKLLDYRYDLLDYNARGEELSSIGISENDALMYLTWQFGDDVNLTTEFMQDIVLKGGRKTIDVELIKAFVSDMYEAIYDLTPLVISIIFIAAMILLLGKGRKENRIALWLRNGYVFTVAMISLLICIYYEYSGRWSHRIVYALLVVVFTCLIFDILKTDCEFDVAVTKVSSASDANADLVNSRRVYGLCFKIGLVIIIFFNIGLLLNNRFTHEKDKRELPDYKAIFSEMNTNKDVLYIADTFTFQNAYKYDVFNAFKQGELDNFVAVGSWYVNSPITDSILGRFSYENPFDALEEGSVKVVLVDNCYVNEKLNYLKEHTGKAYLAELIDEEYGFSLYKIMLNE